MECNRDDANRAKEIAEIKFSEKDITGAKKFALKAQNLFPGLDGISQLLAILDVYISAENKINGELDYYGILGVSPLSDDETVRKHYRKLALSLHPDKNKSIGAEGAFQFVSEAWNLLSDKDKRIAYDSKRNGRVFKTQNVFKTPNDPKNGFHKFTKSTAARTKVTTTEPKGTNSKTKEAEDGIYVAVNTGFSTSSDNQHVAPNKTFWTVCRRCKLQYEFGRMYLNHNLLCPTCHGPFRATETPAPNLNNAETTVKQTYTGVKRDREESPAAKKEEAQRTKIPKKEANLDSTKKGVIDVPDSDGTDADIDVPDSDFHDFDCERSEKCFKQGQVWAAYDDPDGLPRAYALIHKVVSLEPFKMKFFWLDKKPEGAFGEFKRGKHKLASVNYYFSHRANFTKQENGNVFVFPKKGDVCALYSDFDKRTYELVEVDSFDKETGTTVTPLVKVAGFKTVFRRHIDPNATKVISEKEMFLFSHQIPSYLLTGKESANAPKGCRELDPAAIPPEFLQGTEKAEKTVDADCVIIDV